MKRLVFSLLALVTLSVFAQDGQLNGSGYYRVQNVTSGRYISIVDTYAYISNTGSDWDLKAFQMLTGFEEYVAYNPATICYFEHRGGVTYNLSGQGLDLYQKTQHYLNVGKSSKGYELSGAAYGVTKTLSDYTSGGQTYPSFKGNKIQWYILPVNQTDTQYFGVKADIKSTKDNTVKYWTTMKAGFPYQTLDANATKMYCVKEIRNGYAIIEEINTGVKAGSCILFECKTNVPSDNKLTVLDNPKSGSSVGTNLLEGVYFCNTTSGNHFDAKAYIAKTMRVLGLTEDGRPAFVKSNISYIPANTCYLQVSESAPDVLPIVTEEEYITGIEEISTERTNEPKVIYDLLGRRVTTPQKGLYIVNGKKVVVK